MRLTKTRVREILSNHELSPSRALGQNFLCDGQMVDKIVRLAAVEPGDHVIEIGPGLGSLTVGLIDAGAHIEAIEVDRYLIPALTEVVEQSSAPERVTIRNTDIRELDWSDVLADHSWSVVANLPYNIATPLILDLLADRPELTNFLVMVQREAGERLVAEPGSKTYGIPSVLAGYWATGRIASAVKAELFFPKPKVESVLIQLDRRQTDTHPCSYASLQRVVKAGFGQRRKMLRSSLSAVAAPEDFEKAGVEPTSRAEQLNLEQWMNLANLVEQRTS